MQPFVFGGLVVLWTIIISNPIYVALMSLLLGILLAFGIYKYLYGVDSLNKLSPITPIVDEGVKETHSHKNILKNNIVCDDYYDYYDDDCNPIVVTVDMNDFHPIHDDKDSGSSQSNNQYDADEDPFEKVDTDINNNNNNSINGSSGSSGSSSTSLSVFDHSSICISDEDDDDVETSNSELEISINSSDSKSLVL